MRLSLDLLKKSLTYKYIARELFNGKGVWRICTYGIGRYNSTPNWDFYTNCTSEKQAQKLLAINQLMNVAKYLNGDWKPNWNNKDELKYYINKNTTGIYISRDCNNNHSFVYFKSEEAGKQAIDILGEETIKLALCTDW